MSRSRSECALPRGRAPAPGRLVRRLAPLLALAPLAASAQVLTTVEFSFSNPGARSMGFGGAFVALADDATAAFANPAGLIQLVDPEISLEVRGWGYDAPYTAGGRLDGSPTGVGVDTVPGLVTAESSFSTGGVSFVSFVYPWKRWSFAFYQHQQMNFEMNQEIQGIFAPGADALASWRGPIERGFFDLELVSRSFAAGYRVSETLSLGFGLSNFDPDVSMFGEEYLPLEGAPESYFAPASFVPDRLSHVVTISSTRRDWGWAAGFLWAVSPRWRIGGAFREGAELVLEGEAVSGAANRDSPEGMRLAGQSSPWALPDVWALGGSYRSADGRWTASFEWDRVEYSTVIASLSPVLRSPGQGLEDADELHLGGEYAFFAGPSVLGARLGVWLDPDHMVTNSSSTGLARAEHVPGSDELHYAAGLGVALRSFQVDLGVDFSDRRDTVSLSGIYSF